MTARIFSFSLIVLVFAFWSFSERVFLPNLSDKCFRCLCYVASKCDYAASCWKGYCGPFNISRVYWIDAGNITLAEDDPERNNAWQDCARNYECAKDIIVGYLEKFAMDCNGDGVTDCLDYLMVNLNGGFGCTASFNRSATTRAWLARYKECEPTLHQDDD